MAVVNEELLSHLHKQVEGSATFQAQTNKAKTPIKSVHTFKQHSGRSIWHLFNISRMLPSNIVPKA